MASWRLIATRHPAMSGKDQTISGIRKRIEPKAAVAADTEIQRTLMTSIQRFAILGFTVLSSIAFAQQTAPNNGPPVTSQTTTTTTTNPSTEAPVAPTPMTKKEMKAQRKRQKQQEKSANAHAKAEKYHAKALGQDHKSTNAAEQANAPQ